ncbi:TSUP family transporter [Foetidibacter luteolus]|uniref:TSUP family transporter n=1 Tax=Foetidibacter luteolus TaxID=2608880 RepID=UPI00129AD5CE|nr:TSUP family transporter [Foetidibacter luteolus]
MGTETITKPARVLPLFVKLENLRVLIVGGGESSARRLQNLLQLSPGATITIVYPVISEPVKQLAAANTGVEIKEKPYSSSDLQQADVVIIAVQDAELAAAIGRDAVRHGMLFHAGEQGGNAFYTTETSDNLLTAAGGNGGNGKNYTDINDKEGEKRWKKVASWFVFAFFFMIFGHWLLSYIEFDRFWITILDELKQLDTRFMWMIATGFFAQLVDGALGMGYGVTCTTVLLSLGVNLSAISGSIHTAEMFSSGASGYSHYRFGNVNKKLFKVLLIPGIAGAVIGAVLLSRFGDKYADYVRPLLATYTLILGIRIIVVALRKKRKPGKVKNAGWLAGAGGFLDSFGGGGWGPLVTSTLIAKGRTPRFVIGTVSVTEFFVTFSAALTFFTQIGISHWQVIAGLILGGLIAAPLAARLSGKLPVKTSFVAVGAMVIFWSSRILVKAIAGLF